MNIFNLSFGKDSMATLILAAEQGIPIDRVVYCEIKFNDEISAEHPIMAEWIPTAEKRLKELFGITVDHAYIGFARSNVLQIYIATGKPIPTFGKGSARWSLTAITRSSRIVHLQNYKRALKTDTYRNAERNGKRPCKWICLT